MPTITKNIIIVNRIFMEWITIGNLLNYYSTLDPLLKIKQFILYSIIQISEFYNVDKTT
jgi:hypothetical protein